MVDIRAAAEEGHTSVVNRNNRVFLIINVERTILVWVTKHKHREDRTSVVK